MIRRLLLGLALLAPSLGAQTRPAATPAYESPYHVKFTWTDEELVPDLLRGPRADGKDHANVPFSEWYDRSNQRRWGYWGPGMKHFPAPALASGKSPRWLRERVLATGLRYVGYGYEHHHVPDWDPPDDWPLPPGLEGPSGKGLDCSNFTGFVYNLALGLLPNTDIGQQALMTEVKGPGPGRSTRVQRIELPKDFDDYPRTLRTADLLFIKNNRGRVSHVVLWVGSVGRSPKDHPLVLDSTGGAHRDASGEAIPDGIHLRPFTPRSWYFNNASHAIRLIPD
jgi:hypothetical protein